MSNSGAKQALVAILSICAIVASLTWIYFTQFAGPKINLALHTAVGEVMAEETNKLLGNKGQVIVLAVGPGAAPELPAQLTSFKEKIRTLGGVAIKDTIFLDTEDKPKFGAGRGLSARRFLRLMKKNSGADAIVSFVGAPNLSEADFGELEKARLPKFIAESGSATKLKKLFDKRVLQIAVVHRYQFPAPNKEHPKSPRDWFDKRFQIVTAESAATLPASGPE